MNVVKGMQTTSQKQQACQENETEQSTLRGTPHSWTGKPSQADARLCGVVYGWNASLVQVLPMFLWKIQLIPRCLLLQTCLSVEQELPLFFQNDLAVLNSLLK